MMIFTRSSPGSAHPGAGGVARTELLTVRRMLAIVQDSGSGSEDIEMARADARAAIRSWNAISTVVHPQASAGMKAIGMRRVWRAL